MKFTSSNLSSLEVRALHLLIFKNKTIPRVLYLCELLEGFKEEIWIPFMEKVKEEAAPNLHKGQSYSLESLLNLLIPRGRGRNPLVASGVRRTILTSEETLTVKEFVNLLIFHTEKAYGRRAFKSRRFRRAMTTIKQGLDEKTP